MLKEFPKQGIKRLALICPAFVSDCLETLEEIAQEGKEAFLKAGEESFADVPCMNDDPAWVNALERLIAETWTGDVFRATSSIPALVRV